MIETGTILQNRYRIDEKIGQGEGSIALQIHDGGGIKVRWRNLNLQPL